jgi:proteasome beta subunit
VGAAVEALLDASEEDTATGGPDPRRGIYPSVHLVTATGVEELPADEVGEAYRTVVDRREEGGS